MDSHAERVGKSSVEGQKQGNINGGIANISRAGATNNYDIAVRV